MSNSNYSASFEHAYDSIDEFNKKVCFPGGKDHAKNIVDSYRAILNFNLDEDTIFTLHKAIAIRIKMGYDNRRISITLSVQYSSLVPTNKQDELIAFVRKSLANPAANLSKSLETQEQIDLTWHITSCGTTNVSKSISEIENILGIIKGNSTSQKSILNMPHLNYAIFGGEVASDVDIGTTPKGVPYATFFLLVEKEYGVGQIDKISVVGWRDVAETIKTVVSKGKNILVTGRIAHRPFTGKDGSKQVWEELVADSVYEIHVDTGLKGLDKTSGFTEENQSTTLNNWQFESLEEFLAYAKRYPKEETAWVDNTGYLETFKKGYELVDHKKYRDAIIVFQQCLRYNPVAYRARLELITCYTTLGDYLNASSQLEVMSGFLMPKSILAAFYRKYGYLLAEKGDNLGSYACYKYSISIEPSRIAEDELDYLIDISGNTISKYDPDKVMTSKGIPVLTEMPQAKS